MMGTKPSAASDASVIPLAKMGTRGYNKLCKEEISDNVRKEEVT